MVPPQEGKAETVQQEVKVEGVPGGFTAVNSVVINQGAQQAPEPEQKSPTANP